MSDAPGTAEAGLDVRAIAKRGALFAVIAVAAAVGIGALPGVGEVRERLSEGLERMRAFLDGLQAAA